jgi:crossover junction endodeoxyribonuclease RuvC
MNDTLYLGIDLGVNGGLVGIKAGQIVYKSIMPKVEKEIDMTAIKNIFEWLILEHGRVVACFEIVNAMPGQGVSAMFSFGKTAGRIEGLCVGLEIPFHRVLPRTWQKELWEGVTIVKKPDGKNDTKKTSYLAASRLFPKEDFRTSERAKNPHDGVVDACLIGLYSYRKSF